MSIRITEDTPEPKEYGAYLFTYPDSPGIYPILIMHDPSHRGKTWIQDLCWETWEVVRRFHVGCAMESLAAHDARVRREALELSDEELGLVVDSCIDAGILASNNPIRAGLKAVAKHREASDVRA